MNTLIFLLYLMSGVCIAGIVCWFISGVLNGLDKLDAARFLAGEWRKK